MGLTQQQLADAVGININTLASYERNMREPKIDTIKKFTCFFNVSADYLLGLSNNPQPKLFRPDIYPEVAADTVETVISTLEKMLDNARDTENYAILMWYAEIFLALLGIDEAAVHGIYDMRKQYPGFDNYFNAHNIAFDGKPFMRALINNSPGAVQYSKDLSDSVFKIKDSVKIVHQKINDIFETVLPDVAAGDASLIPLKAPNTSMLSDEQKRATDLIVTGFKRKAKAPDKTKGSGDDGHGDGNQEG